MSQTVIHQGQGHPDIYVWDNGADQVWACCAYDHGPMCRLCQPVDETLLALLQNVASGNMLARAKPDGEFEFKMTVKGNAAAENLVHATVEGADLWARLQERLR